MNELPKQRWGCLQWGIVIGIVVLLAGLLLPKFNATSDRSNQMVAVMNCKMIILALRQFSQDNGSPYPDGLFRERKSANQVFRELFKEGIVNDERTFGCPLSRFDPDNEMGETPNFEKTLSPGECHWMLLKSQTDAAHPKTPIVIENALGTAWPPKWESDGWSGKTPQERGRSWGGQKIIVGRNDGSVQIEKLRPDGTLDWHSPPNLDEHGKSWIDYLTPEQVAKLEYWDIEEK